MPQFINIADTAQLSSTYDGEPVEYQVNLAFTDSLLVSGTTLSPLLLGPSVIDIIDSTTEEVIDHIIFVVTE